MNEQQQHSPDSMELPKPQVNEVKRESSEPFTATPEEAAASIRVEQGIKTSTPSQRPLLLDNQTDGLSQVAQQADDTSVTATTQSLVADETDLIEKEWVVKAKHIVEQTKSDPHLQSKEIVKVKADYLKKRYNKEIKVIED